MNKYEQMIIKALEKKSSYKTIKSFFEACGDFNGYSWGQTPRKFKETLLKLNSQNIINYQLKLHRVKKTLFIERGERWGVREVLLRNDDVEELYPVFGVNPISKENEIEEGLKLIANAMRKDIEEDYIKQLEDKDKTIKELEEKLREKDQEGSLLKNIFGRKN